MKETVVMHLSFRHQGSVHIPQVLIIYSNQIFRLPVIDEI